MATYATPRARPSGLTRLFFKLPVWLYRLKLGWLLGERFLLLKHVGRKSGRHYETVVEVVRHDEETDTYVVASGWGETADWFKNVMATPEVEIAVGRRHIPAKAERLPAQDAVDELRDYERRHPIAARELTRVLGYHVDDSDNAYEALADHVVLVAFRPRRAAA